MANVHILADPPSDAGIYSGGAWVPTLPLVNLTTQQVGQAARSVGPTAAATRFVCDLGFTCPLSMIALIAHNLSTAATVRIRVSDAADGSAPSIDTTVPALRPNVAWGAMPWGAFPWDGFRADYQPGGPITFFKNAATVFGRYVLIDIADPGNAAGFVQIGRFMAGDAFVPRINMSYGAALRFLDDSTPARSRGGQVFWDKRPKRRQVTLQFGALSEGEAWGAIYDLQNRLGLTGNLLLVYDPADASAVLLRRTIYGGLAQLDDIVTATASVDAPYACNLTIVELL